MKELSKDQENLIEVFKEYLRKKNMSENTERAYIRTVRQLLFASGSSQSITSSYFWKKNIRQISRRYPVSAFIP